MVGDALCVSPILTHPGTRSWAMLGTRSHSLSSHPVSGSSAVSVPMWAHGRMGVVAWSYRLPLGWRLGTGLRVVQAPSWLTPGNEAEGCTGSLLADACLVTRLRVLHSLDVEHTADCDQPRVCPFCLQLHNFQPVLLGTFPCVSEAATLYIVQVVGGNMHKGATYPIGSG